MTAANFMGTWMLAGVASPSLLVTHPGGFEQTPMHLYAGWDKLKAADDTS